MERFHRIIAPAFLVLAVLLAGQGMSGCAYLNTFYLTRQNFGEGERLRKNGAVPNDGNMTKAYNAAIENGALILQNYKTSRYVDDSLIIMGMSYFYLQDYSRAKTKFDELLTVFPQSEFAEQATYYRARCYLELEQGERARADLYRLAASGSRSFRGQAGLSLAEMNYRDSNWSELTVTAGRVVDSRPEDAVMNEALSYLGEALYRLGKYDDALVAFRKLEGKKLAPGARFTVNTRMALCLARRGEYDEALAILRGMQSRGEFASFAPGIRLEIGMIYELKGDTVGAIEAFSTMAADFPDSTAAREAWYRVGMITLRDISKASDARDAFAKVTPNMRIAETWFTDAEAKVTQIDTLKVRMERIDKLTDKPDERAHERFLLAELFTWSLDHREEALTQYRKIIEEAPQTEFAARSHYLLGLAEIDANGEPSVVSGDSVMRDTVFRYPESRFAQELKIRLGIMDAAPDVRLLKEADFARMSNRGSDVCLRLYQSVIDSFPNTRSAYQARFGRAWCLEHDKKDRTAAEKIYRDLAAETPNEYNRDLVNLAIEKMRILGEEESIIAESRKQIAYFESEITRGGENEQDADAPKISPGEYGYSGFEKIRARNARIRSRYYPD